MTTTRNAGGSTTPGGLENHTLAQQGRTGPPFSSMAEWYEWQANGGRDYSVNPQTVANPERDLTISGSILEGERVVPAWYGPRVVTGTIGSKYYDGSRYLYLGIIFGVGEQASVGSLKMNGEASPSGVTFATPHVGDGSTTLSTYLTTSTSGWSAADTTLWKTLCHVAVKIDTWAANAPGSFSCTAALGGLKCTPIGGGTAAASANPAVAAYDTFVSSWWRGWATSRLHTASWSALEGWCDEVMNDATKRYSIGAKVEDRNPATATSTILSHAHAFPFIDSAGLVRVWFDGLPAAISGSWSASMSNTLTGTGGAATTEISVGQEVLVDTVLTTVTDVAGDNEITVDYGFIALTGVKVRPVTITDIRPDQWVNAPSAREASKLPTPDKLKITFPTALAASGNHEVELTYGAGATRRAEESMQFTDKGPATRWGETYLKTMHLEYYQWAGRVAPEIAAVLEPGDLVRFDTDLLDDQIGRVLHPINRNTDGSASIVIREFDPAVHSTSTATTDTLPSLGGGWSSSDGPVVPWIGYRYSSAIYNMVSPNIDTGGVDVGNSSAPVDIRGDSGRLPNSVPLYALTTGGAEVGLLMMNASNQIQLGDGSYPIYLASPSIILPSGGAIEADHTSKYTVVSYGTSPIKYVNVGNSSCWTTITGDDTNGVTVFGNGLQAGFGDVYSRFCGYQAGTAAVPSLGEDMDWCFYLDTVNGDIGCFWRIAGSVYRVT